MCSMRAHTQPSTMQSFLLFLCFPHLFEGIYLTTGKGKIWRAHDVAVRPLGGI